MSKSLLEEAEKIKNEENVPKKQHSKRNIKLGILIGVACIFGAGKYISDGITPIQEKKIEELNVQIAKLKEENIPLKFMVTKKTDDSITVRIRFYDLAGKEILSSVKNPFEMTLKGKELFFDFELWQTTSFDDNYYIAFPSKLFTDKIAPDEGISLLEEYMNDNYYPAIFENGSIESDDAKKALIDIYTKLLEGQKTKINFGNAVHDISNIKAFQVNTVYKLICHTKKGGIEIQEER